jgi:hypothetical protein
MNLNPSKLLEYRRQYLGNSAAPWVLVIAHNYALICEQLLNYCRFIPHAPYSLLLQEKIFVFWLVVQDEINQAMTNLLQGDWVDLGEPCPYFALNKGLILHRRDEAEGLKGRHVDFQAALESLG